MVHSPRKIACKLDKAYIEEHGPHHNFTMVLTGNEMALAAAATTIEAQFKNCYAERDVENNTLRITTALPNDDAMEHAVAFAQKLQAATDFQLGHVYMEPAFEPLGTGEKAVYIPVIYVHSTTPASDHDNIAGQISAKLVTRNLPLFSCYIPDPRSEGDYPQLISVNDMCKTDTDALAHAEQAVRQMEKAMGIFNAPETHLTLSDLRTQQMRNPIGHGHLNVATARLRGAPDEIDDALRTIHHRHRNRIAELARGEDYVDVGSATKETTDPTGLLAALHLTTDCELPVDIQPKVVRDQKEPYGYVPVLETRVHGDGSGLSQPTLRYAATRYAGAYLHDKHTVPEELDPHAPTRITMLTEHTTEEGAQHAADILAERLRARLHGNSRE